MKHLSKLDLLNKKVRNNSSTNTGSRILNFIFKKELQYAQIDIKIPRIDLLRGEVLLSDIADSLEDDDPAYYGVETLIILLYIQFIRQISKGVDLFTVGKELINKINKYRPITIQENYTETKPNTFALQNFNIPNQTINKDPKEQEITITLNLKERFIYRGEILLYDLEDLFPDLEITVEETISILYMDFIDAIKKGHDNGTINNILESFSYYSGDL
ncbi:hypothetical protein [Desertibacillus haloalkaliphilus]|uniref:hypothetical protein n=1 Tax=Desertibacillus haloalkaliphilus TaxID=1328930 RepID=UPI001C274059|nr:hypothetical protein [Desertibacillus haloalkaliphilus]MBU8908072.1 hypothetical protein [Desertibacillus haloalkaliphilus]